MSDANLKRVNSRISGLIIEFCRSLGDNGVFYMEDLRRHVAERLDSRVAPASPDRILRDLRKAGKLDYAVVSRSESLYVLISLDSECQS